MPYYAWSIIKITFMESPPSFFLVWYFLAPPSCHRSCLYPPCSLPLHMVKLSLLLIVSAHGIAIIAPPYLYIWYCCHCLVLPPFLFVCLFINIVLVITSLLLLFVLPIFSRGYFLTISISFLSSFSFPHHHYSWLLCIWCMLNRSPLWCHSLSLPSLPHSLTHLAKLLCLSYFDV